MLTSSPLDNDWLPARTTSKPSSFDERPHATRLPLQAEATSYSPPGSQPSADKIRRGLTPPNPTGSYTGTPYSAINRIFKSPSTIIDIERDLNFKFASANSSPRHNLDELVFIFKVIIIVTFPEFSK